MAPEICPNCGAEVPRNSKACPECGSDEETGWSEGAHTEDLNLPEEKFDYGEFVKREFGGKSPVPRGIQWFWWVIAVGVLIGSLFLWLR
jgi:hypothetical protein